jgi:hypothetical protein
VPATGRRMGEAQGDEVRCAAAGKGWDEIIVAGVLW